MTPIKQIFRLQILPLGWEKKLKKWAKLGAPIIIGVVVLGIYAETNQDKSDTFMVITKFFDTLIPIIVLVAVFGNFGKFFKNINLTLQDQTLIYKQKNRVKWKISVKDITSIFEQINPNTKKVKTLFVTPQKNYELEYGIIDKEKMFSSIKMQNPGIHIKLAPNSARQELSTPTTSINTNATNTEDILRIAIFVVIIIGLLIYFLY